MLPWNEKKKCEPKYSIKKDVEKKQGLATFCRVIISK